MFDFFWMFLYEKLQSWKRKNICPINGVLSKFGILFSWNSSQRLAFGKFRENGMHTLKLGVHMPLERHQISCNGMSMLNLKCTWSIHSNTPFIVFQAMFWFLVIHVSGMCLHRGYWMKNVRIVGPKEVNFGLPLGFWRIRYHTNKFRERKCFPAREVLGFGDLLEDTKELEH